MNSYTTSSLSLPGYTQLTVLSTNSRTEVYRAVRQRDSHSIVLKVMCSDHPNFSELVQFRNQFVIAQNLRHAGIVTPIALERCGNGYALIMPDEGFVPLSTYWQKQQYQGEKIVAEVLAIALRLTDIFHYLGGERIIHKDIKPDNLLIHPQTQDVQLIDFSIASLLPKERQELENPNILEGTLAYIAPEQTGRMNRGIDYRSDFYSLGVTLYELLTGQLPFPISDPMALVHHHLATPPPVAHSINADVPPILSEIVLKLMAKNAEDRYQSALGLKHDLDRCRKEWTEKGSRIWFPLGERDMSDRFLIPETLYGRQQDIIALLEAFNRASSGHPELMLVAGFSGIGKTAVVNEIHKPVTRQSGYFIKGKFDQLNRNIPFSAFVQALRNLMRQILGEPDSALSLWKQKILNALGRNAQIILDVLPEVESIIGAQPQVPQLSGSAAQNRFNRLFSQFIQIFATQEHPLVVFLDDLQWADMASLALLKQLMAPVELDQPSATGRSTDQRYLLILGAYRDNEVYAAHPLLLTLEALKKEHAPVRTLTLAPLDYSDVNHLVADTLRCEGARAAPLARLIYQKTQGNPFFTNQFLQGLHQEGCITFHHPQPGLDAEKADGGWQCDLGKVRQLALSDDVVEFMVGRLRKLPDIDQTTLRWAACLGNSFDLETLALVADMIPEETAMNLWRSLREGVLVPEGKTYKFFHARVQQGLQDDAAYVDHQDDIEQTDIIIRYRFLHDRVQQAAYALIPPEQKQVTHLQIGQQLLIHTSPAQQEHRIFDIVRHLNQGRDLLETPSAQLELVQLNLQAGHKAKESTAYQTAFDLFSTGLSILSKFSAQSSINPWEKHYDLTLSLYQEGAIAANLVGQFDIMVKWIGVALDHTDILLDRIPFYETQIQAYVAQKQLPDAIQLGIGTLDELGQSFSQEPTPEDFETGIQTIATHLVDRSVGDLIHLPAMDDPKAVAILKILFRLSSVLVMAAPQLMPFCMFKAVQLSISAGNSFLSAPAYVTYGMILCGAVGDITTGYQFGQLALQIVDRYEGKAVQAKTLVRFNGGVRHWQDPLRDTLDDLAKGYQLALEVGDLESAAICAEVYGYHSYFSGQELGQLAQELKTYSQGIESIQQQTMLYWNESYRQHVLNLLGHGDIPWQMAGPAYDEAIHLPMQQDYKDGFGMAMAYLLKAIAAYLFQQYDQALEYLDITANFLQSFAPFAAAPIFYFYRVLSYLALVPQQESLSTGPDWVEPYCTQLQHWATHAPTNHQHKVELIEAERLRLLGQRYEAAERYDQAITGAKQHGYGQEEALANECAARFYLDWGKKRVAAGYMQEAYYGYAHWGAKAKTDHLEQYYSHLLQPILQPSSQSPSLFDTLATLAPANVSVHSSLPIPASEIISTSTTTVNTALDFASVLKASQAISTMIELDDLLAQLTHIILENSGGDRCALILPNNSGNWDVRAIATSNDTTLCTNPLDQHPDVPAQLIYYVKNTKDVTVIDDVRNDSPVIDTYLNHQNPQSVLCLPLLNQTTVNGVLYVQNQSMRGAFTRDRIAVINFLCAQAAITLENTRLYRLEREKTAQLQLSELRLKTLFEKAADSILLLGHQGFIDCNQATLKLFGYSEKSSICRVQPSALSPNKQPDGQVSIDKANAMIQTALDTGYHRFEWMHQRANGQLFWTDVMLTAIPYNGQEILHCIVRDISDRKRLEQEQQRINAILETSSDYIGLADVDGNILWLNRQLIQLHPERYDPLKDNLTIADFHPQWVIDTIMKEGMPTAIQQGTWLGEMTILDAQENEIPVSQLLIAHKSSQGDVKYFSTIMRDIRHQKKAELAILEKSQALEQALEELQRTELKMVQSEKMSALGNLVAGVAHEMNNPIGFVSGNINELKLALEDITDCLQAYRETFPNPGDAIQDQLDDVEIDFLLDDAPKMLASMRAGCDRIRDISTSLRIFSRADTETKVKANIHEGINSTLLILKYRLKARENRPEINVLCHYGDLPDIHCFPGQLNQVFMNLLANAIDMFDEMTQEYSFHELSAKTQEITIQTNLFEANSIEIRISDNGKGMPEAMCVKVFDRKFTTKAVGKGTGLGLAIARQVVEEKHSGQLTVTSSVGQGTEFVIHLPITG